MLDELPKSCACLPFRHVPPRLYCLFLLVKHFQTQSLVGCLSPSDMPLEFRGVHAEIYADRTREVDAEGALSSGKTTLALAKEIEFLQIDRGIHSWGFRYSDVDTKTKLRPAFEEVCGLQHVEVPAWNNVEQCYECENGSRFYMFGIKSADRLSRYSKLRGVGVSRIYVDQPEEMPGDIANELPARLRQKGHEHQLTFTPNPPNERHWLAKRFPVDNSIAGRKYYAVSLYDNAHNLKPETIAGLELSFPVEHAKHDVVILGKRGENVIGDAIYEATFTRRHHIRPLRYNPNAILFEAFDVGKQNPCWVIAQQHYSGGLLFLGGMIGKNLFLEDFLPLVQQQRAKWFPKMGAVKTCCTSISKHNITRYTAINVLESFGFHPIFRESGVSPDVQLAMIERLAGLMRRRTLSGDEFLGVESDPAKWLQASTDGLEPCQFIAQGFESGYVWDEHTVSVGNNEIRQPFADDWFEHGMRCAEALELNFGAEHLSQQAQEERDRAARMAAKDSAEPYIGPMSWLGS